jgi:hypothetical protein
VDNRGNAQDTERLLHHCEIWGKLKGKYGENREWKSSVLDFMSLISKIFLFYSRTKNDYCGYLTFIAWNKFQRSRKMQMLKIGNTDQIMKEKP